MQKGRLDPHRKTLQRFAYWTLVYELIVVFLYAYYVRNSPAVGAKHLETYYPWFQDVNTMMLIGFGFLMTFVRTHSWGSLGFTFFLNALVMQAYIIFRGFWHKVFNGFSATDPYIYIDIPTITFGSYAVAGMLIALGALLGRITPAQMLFMGVMGCFMYSLNEHIVYDVLKIIDVGGSIPIHTFGGYFGLAVSLALGRKNGLAGISATTTYHSTMFSMFGTLFLWMFWPSFNSGTMPDENSVNAQLRLWTITNTLLSLTGSCLATFITSKFWRGKFHMEDILNATLAGGVIIGASSSLISNPTWSLVLGIIAGFASTLGFWKLGPWLTEKGVIDVCGIHNLHAIPGLMGGVASAIVFAVSIFAPPTVVTNLDSGFDYGKQAGMQIAGTFVTVGIAGISGYIIGLILSVFKNIPAWDFFEDKAFWDTHSEAQSHPQPLKELGELKPHHKHHSAMTNINQTNESMIELTQTNPQKVIE